MRSRPRALSIWLGLVALLTLAARAPRGDDAALSVTFLGNEGFLLEADGRKVLVDALVGDELPTYVQQSDELRAKLGRAAPPFDGVELVLATHVHADHFSAAEVGAHLIASPKARFVSTPQAVARMRAELEGFAQIEPRVLAVGPPDGEAEHVEGLELDVLALHHGRDREPPIENDAFLFTLGDWTILHMGDSECTPAELAALGLDELEIDLAFVPSWYLDAGPWKGAIESALAPARTVVMHLAPDWKTAAETSNQRDSRARVARIEAAYPEAIVFAAALEARRFESLAEEDD